MNEQEIREAISRYKWYHIIRLTETISTPGSRPYVPAQNLCMKYLKSLDLTGARVLDIGCRDGLFSFAAESMGAAEVIGIDNDLSKPATEFLIPFFKSKVKMEQLNIYDLKPETFGLFDVVIFPGVLYHLRFPFLGLRAIRDVMKPGGHLVTETPIFEGQRNNAMLFCPTGEESPYEPTSCTFFNEKGLSDTLQSFGFTTKSIEYLALEHDSKLRRLGRQIDLLIQTCLSSGNRPPIKRVTRAVFHSTFTGFNKDSSLTQYWEGTHNIHTRIGG
jgi:Ribosomal protein L11 methylase